MPIPGLVTSLRPCCLLPTCSQQLKCNLRHTMPVIVPWACRSVLIRHDKCAWLLAAQCPRSGCQTLVSQKRKAIPFCCAFSTFLLSYLSIYLSPLVWCLFNKHLELHLANLWLYLRSQSGFHCARETVPPADNRKCAMKREMRKYIRLRYDLQLGI